MGSIAMLAKREAAEQAQILLNGPFVIFDTETTGVGGRDEIIQLAAIDQAGTVLVNTRIKPTIPIPNSHIHGITDEMVQDAPGFPDLYLVLHYALGNQIQVAYNIAFDSQMLRQVCRKHNLPVIAGTEKCAMLLYSQFRGEWDSYRQKYRWHKLGAVMNQLNLQWEGDAHDALADCRATLQVLKAMAAWREAEA